MNMAQWHMKKSNNIRGTGTQALTQHCVQRSRFISPGQTVLVFGTLSSQLKSGDIKHVLISGDIFIFHAINSTHHFYSHSMGQI